MTSTAVHSFDLPVSTDFLTKPVYPLPVVYVAYKLWYNGKITDIHYNMPHGFGGMVKDWVLFDEHVRAACESNKKRFKLPGRGGKGNIGKYEDPVEAYYLESNRAYKR